MYSLRLSGSEITDEALSELAHAKKLRILDLSDTNVGDASVDALSQIKFLLKLNLAGTKVSNHGVAGLAGPGRRISSIDLSRTKIDDVGLRNLHNVSAHEYAFAKCKVTDQGLKDLILARGQDLSALDLSDTQVTDASMRELAGANMKGPIKLVLTGTRVSDEGIRCLMAAYPHALVIKQPRR